MGTRVVLFAVSPLLYTKRTKQSIALTTGNWLLDYIFADDAFEVIIERRDSLFAIDVELLMILIYHAFQECLNLLWLIVFELLLCVLDKSGYFFVKFLQLWQQRLLLEQIHLIQL